MNNNKRGFRIDSSTPKSFYCSPKSYHYIPFAQRRSKSVDLKRQTDQKLNPSSICEAQSCQNWPRSKLSDQSRPNLFANLNANSKDSSLSSASSKVTFFNSNQSGIIKSGNQLKQPIQQQNKKVPESGILQQTRHSIYNNDNDEIQKKLDDFKIGILDDIIQCGVYTDRIIHDCISKNVLKNSTLPMANLQQAISELLQDIGVFNSEVNQMTRRLNSEPTDNGVFSSKDEESVSDEDESLSVIPSVESDSDKSAKEASEFGSVSIKTTDSLTTLNSSYVTDIFN